MVQLLGLVLLAFLITAVLLVPFIDLLFYLRRKYLSQKDKKTENLNSQTPIHDALMKSDFDTPVGGGLLLIPVMILTSIAVSLWSRGRISIEFEIIYFSLLTFGCLGLVDDIRHIFHTKVGKFKGLSSKTIFFFQSLFAICIAVMLFFTQGLSNIYIPIIGNVVLGWFYIPLAALIIVTFSNAFNISDGLDGLSSGLLMICLFAFLVLAHTVFNFSLSVFVGIWIGALIAYLYFNVFPARIYLGDAGAFGFGATLAVIGLLTGKIVALAVIGGVYMLILLSSFLQIMSKKLLHRKLFPVAPIHIYLKYIGWPEPKIVNRFWLLQILLSIFGLWLALLSK